ncbi:MAG: hypothetical protein SNJ71_04175, partial [Bacteroidales bacterium]
PFKDESNVFSSKIIKNDLSRFMQIMDRNVSLVTTDDPAVGHDIMNAGRAVGAITSSLGNVLSNAFAGGFNDSQSFSQRVYDFLTRLPTGGQGHNSELVQYASAIRDLLSQRDTAELSRDLRISPDRVASQLLENSGIMNFLNKQQEIHKKEIEIKTDYINNLLNIYQKMKELDESYNKLNELNANLQKDLSKRRSPLNKEREFNLFKLENARFRFIQNQERLTGNRGIGLNPEAMGQRLVVLVNERAALHEKMEKIPLGSREKNDEFKILGKRFAEVSKEIDGLNSALKNLTDATNMIADINERIAVIESKREMRESFAEEFLTSDPRAQVEMNQAMILASQAVQKGNLIGYDHRQISQIFRILNKVGNNALPGLKGMTGVEAKRMLLQNTLPGIAGLNAEMHLKTNKQMLIY